MTTTGAGDLTRGLDVSGNLAELPAGPFSGCVSVTRVTDTGCLPLTCTRQRAAPLGAEGKPTPGVPMRLPVLLVPLFVSSLAVAGDYEPTDISKYVGTWNVTSTARESTCDSGQRGSVNAYVWIVSSPGPNQVSVAVQGETGFPLLTGEVNGSTLWVSGVGGPALFVPVAGGAERLVPASSFNLTAQADGTLRGTRIYSGFNTVPDLVVHRVGCYVIFDVVAKR